MQKLFPLEIGRSQKPDGLAVAPLAEIYSYPVSAYAERKVWVRANMVASADGAAVLSGRAGDLSGNADHYVFHVLRSLADVILVGAQTARVEGYRAVRPDEVHAGLRAGRASTPSIAVITRRLSLDLEAPLFTAAPPYARTIVVTTELAPRERRAIAARHAEVVIAGAESVDLNAALGALAERGHTRILAEGGPHLLGQLITAGLLDELCLTISPLLAGPGATRIAASPDLGVTSPKRGWPLRLEHILEDSGFLLCRYIAERSC